MTIASAAKGYAVLCDHIFIITSEGLRESDYYALHFYPQNFLHLTGAKTKMKSSEFFARALNGELKANDSIVEAKSPMLLRKGNYTTMSGRR